MWLACSSAVAGGKDNVINKDTKKYAEATYLDRINSGSSVDGFSGCCIYSSGCNH